jgi:hypothetical protein
VSGILDNTAWLASKGVILDDSLTGTTPAPSVHIDDSADADVRDDDDDTMSSGTEEGNDCAAAPVDQTADPAPRQSSSPKRRFNPVVVGCFGAAAALATAVTLVLTLSNSAPKPVAAPASTVAPRVIEVPAPTPLPDADGPLPFTASADCPAGSTSAQSVADPDAQAPWVCVRSIDGQVLQIDLGRTYVITAVSIVPGAVTAADPASSAAPDPWMAHRVVTRLQWIFNDTDRTVKAQNTGNVRGESVVALQPPVLASKITVIVQETSRPPAMAPASSTAPSPQPGSGGSILGDILGADNQSPNPLPPNTSGADLSLSGRSSDDDASDGTFAVSAIKIIGHKAT